MVEITNQELKKLNGPNQVVSEWKEYLRFIQRFCKDNKIENPVVVEIGTHYGHQKAHYELFLNATHIGIDISNKLSKPDIHGDSHKIGTMTKLKEMLNGRSIDILFLDGAHTYHDTLTDYLAYGSLTTGIIAFHDIQHSEEIRRLWLDLNEAEKDNADVTFWSIGAWGNKWCELGIGMIVKGGGKNG